MLGCGAERSKWAFFKSRLQAGLYWAFQFFLTFTMFFWPDSCGVYPA